MRWSTYMNIKKLFSGLGILLTTCLGIGVTTSVISSKNTSTETEAAATIVKPVTRVYIEDQVDAGTTVLAIESISFADGYSHTEWRAFLTHYLECDNQNYDTAPGKAMPSEKGWSYMSSSETEKYLICPTGSINFTFTFPEWVSAFSYKAVGNLWWNWFDVNGAAVGVHSSWGIGKKLNSYIFNDGGWKMNANLDNTDQTHTWGDVIINRRVYDSKGWKKKLVYSDDKLEYSMYYKVDTYEVFGQKFNGWYTTDGLSTPYVITLSTWTVHAYLEKIDAYLTGTMTSWSHDSTYDMTTTEDYQYMISVTLEKDTEFKVYVDGVYYGYENVITTDNRMISEGYITYGTYDYGTRIKVGKTSTFEIYIKSHDGYAIWIQQDHNAEANEFALLFLENITCNSDSVRFDISTWNNVSGTSSMEYQYSLLTKGAKDVFKEATPNEEGSKVEQAVARYDRILYKYGYGPSSYHDFMERSPSTLSSGSIISLFRSDTDSSNFVIIIIVSSLISLSMITLLVSFKRKSMY